MVIGDNGRGMTMTCSDEGDSCGDDDGVMAMAMFNVMAIVMLMVMCMVSGGV